MIESETVGAFAIVPSSDLSSATAFWKRLGFASSGGGENYLIFTGWGCEVHVIRPESRFWSIPEGHNPLGVFIRTPHVEEITAGVEDLIIRPGGILRHREWGLYEVGLCGPDGLLVRIGWPSRLMLTA